MRVSGEVEDSLLTSSVLSLLYKVGKSIKGVDLLRELNELTHVNNEERCNKDILT